MEPYSVLMSVYVKENPNYLQESMSSIFSQSVPTDDFVLVCDGPLTEKLDAVIVQFAKEYLDKLVVVRLPDNQGIGPAANEGLKYCKHDLIAKMDSDDIACPDRCELQLKVFDETPSLAITGGQIAEFEGTPQNVAAIRRVPLSYEEILRFAKRRNPFNNQTLMYRKTAVQAVGGYEDLRRCEDYDLMGRLLHKGYAARNIDRVLVYYRLNENAIRRRSDWTNSRAFFRVRWKLYRMGFSSLWDVIVAGGGQLALMILPIKLKAIFYKVFLRK